MSKIFIKNSADPKSPHRVILDHIPYGSDDAVSVPDLARALGEDPRQIRQRIQNARIDGFIIAGTDAGIFIPETVAELREYVKRTTARIQTSQETIDPAVELLGELDDE